MTTKFARTSLTIVLFALSTVALAHAGTNLVQNGGFETGNFQDWTVTGDMNNIGVCKVSTCPGSFAPEEGTYAAYFGPVGDTSTISQTLTTTPGQEYQLSFYLADPQGGTPNYFSVTFGNTTLSLTDFGAAFGWQQFILDTQATSSQTTLSFTFRQDPNFWFLDNVSVTASGQGTVPEPGTLALFGSGAVGLAAFARRKFFP